MHLCLSVEKRGRMRGRGGGGGGGGRIHVSESYED